MNSAERIEEMRQSFNEWFADNKRFIAIPKSVNELTFKNELYVAYLAGADYSAKFFVTQLTKIKDKVDEQKQKPKV